MVSIKFSNTNQEIQSFIDYWQQFITDWWEYIEEHTKLKRNFLSGGTNYLKFGEAGYSMDYFPEPYFGDPDNLLKNNIQAIFINLNPGSAKQEKSVFANGDVIKVFKKQGLNYLNTLRVLESNYQNDKENCHMKDTFDWWNEYRVNWIDTFLKPTFLNDQLKINNILGLELTPWHSKAFNEVKSCDATFIKESVIKYAVAFSKYVNNPFLNNHKRTIILSCGSGFKKLFKHEKWEIIDSQNLSKCWCISRWVYSSDAMILNFHQTNNKGAVPLNFPNDKSLKNEIQDMILSVLAQPI